MIDFAPDLPTFFWTDDKDAEAGWTATPLSKLLRTKKILKFDVLDPDYAPEGQFTEMVLEDDGLYHWRSPDGTGGHWYGLLGHSPSSVLLVGNWRDDDGGQGVFIAVWPME